MTADGDTLARLSSAVPANVASVCAKLTEAGHEAVIVGGCVRDVILGRTPQDWDVATSAHPDDVLALFKHTIATGLQHGTVTIVTGKGKHSHVEVTTYRGEGAYSDARRPDEVRFGVPLREDLQRRDLTVNAIAYEPTSKRIIDPFNGVEDIAARRLRAVGSAVDRFTEDGLRVMRAVRFAAQLDFDLDPETEAGIPPALPSLAKVSRERVSDELRKLLATRQPSRGLRPAYTTGIIESILPELAARLTDEKMGSDPISNTHVGSAGTSLVRVDDWLARIDRSPVAVRLAAMMAPIEDQKRTLELTKALKFSNQEAELAAALVRVAEAEPTTDDPDVPGYTPAAVRWLLSTLDKAKRPFAVELWAAWPREELAKIAREVIGDPMDVGDLVVRGPDIMKALDIKPGPQLGRILQMLRDKVIDDPTLNTREALLREAQTCELETSDE
jgi:tRNA nucleotidyltransferase (CCA-adding enzyme)